MDLAVKLTKNAREFPQKPAIIYKDIYTSYAKLNQRAAQFANAALSLGLRPREKMAIILKNRTEYLEIVHGLVKAGITIVPVNWRFSSEEIRYVISNSDASAVVVSEEFLEKLNPIMTELRNIPPDRYIHLDGTPPAHMHPYEEILARASTREPAIENKPKDPFYIGYTSGTTGFPKGAVNPHGDWAVKEMALSAIFGMGRDDIQLLTMPLFHANALSSSCVGHYTGQTIVIMERFDAEQMLRLIERYRTTFSSMVPTMFNRLKNLPPEVFRKYDVSSMRGMIQSSAPLPFSTKQWIIENFKNCGLHEFYGGTEVGVVTYLSPEEQLKKPGSVGKAIPTIEVKLVDDAGNEVPQGQVGQVISRPLQGAPIARAAGYYKDAKSTSKWFKDGWFYSGDMAYMDADGYYYLVDRKIDLIISGGENVYPAEIEAVLYRHPKVFEAAVIGIPDDDWGESVKAVIILKEGQSATAEEIINYCREHLAGYKVPRSVNFVKDVPKTATGKILKKEIRAPYWKGRRAKI